MSARPAFRHPLVQSVSRSGSVSPAISAARTAPPLAPGMSVTTRVSFTFPSSSVFCSRCAYRATSATSCLGVRVRSRSSSIGDGGHEAARNQPMRQQIGGPGGPGRILLVALAARNIPDVLRVGEHQRERRFVFEDVPHRLPVHAVSLHGHLCPAGFGQPCRQCEQARRRGPQTRGARSLPRGWPPPARNAVTWRECTSNPAHRGCNFHPSSLVRKGAGVESARANSTGRTHRTNPVSQYGVLAGLPVQLRHGSRHQYGNRPLRQRPALHRILHPPAIAVPVAGCPVRAAGLRR